MALFFDQIQQEPQTHVLIIGVGNYPFLSGGANELQQEFDGAQLLAQLSSPPISAEAFYQTAIELHESNSWIKPLGSVEVLISLCPDPLKASQ